MSQPLPRPDRAQSQSKSFWLLIRKTSPQHIRTIVCPAIHNTLGHIDELIPNKTPVLEGRMHGCGCLKARMVRWTTGIWYIGTGRVDESTENGCCTGPDEQCTAVSTTTYFLWRSQALIIRYYRKVGGTREADDLEGKKRVSCTGSGISTTFLPTISLDRTRVQPAATSNVGSNYDNIVKKLTSL